ncbi:TetR family transcriptional regulator [Zhengella mangrovi]|uniref:TetR family transcriptional regulator n=1 Tax=Zhengella mangrovi TaxID=1982044 RepID=A0A2G1QPW7_9HYPH|nr:TetR/AcrR family transcriptional regulator C-terminal domain-containing protein [Zhengella mangrovi]PHP67535.1 TetR family transcriptional regulator [Zhengella mangrovi]
MNARAQSEAEFTPRQREVLDAVLALMVKEGGSLSTARVAREARCSKETLYKWFGDRDGLLTATVRWQASKVKSPALPQSRLTGSELRDALRDFAASWLTVVSGEPSIALNRAAIGHAGTDKSRLGDIVLRNGPYAMARRLEPLFRLGRDEGLLQFEAVEDAFSAFFGLAVGDIQIRMLLGEEKNLGKDDIERRAERAADRFLALFGTTARD